MIAKSLITETIFTAQWESARRQIAARRSERKRNLDQMAVIDPEGFNRLKIKKHEKERTRKKRVLEKRKMKEHILTVHQSMRFACKICGKTYASSLSLRNHVRLNHEGKKPPPEKCLHCDKIFKGIGTLKRHIDNVHEKKRPHACHLCGLSFSQSGNLKNHLKGKHKHVT